MGIFMRGDRFFIAAAGICLVAICCGSAFGQGKVKVIKPKPTPTPAVQTSSEPDKVLYDRAMTDLKKKRYIEERLSLDVLINTYPDSEYLAKAKLAKADSFYQEGGVSNLTQAIGEYKSFVVFFPFLTDEDAYAQMQIAMSHYKMMGKSDRDDSEAANAEVEFQTYMVKYPDNKLTPLAEQRLRDVQEVIADGEYKVARFYYLRPDYRASAARLVELTQRYPLYSQSDEALWMLADIYARAKKLSKNEDDKNHWGDLQGRVLDQIVMYYPLSLRSTQAKEQLKAMGMAVPKGDSAAIIRMQKQAEYERLHHQKSIVKAPMSMLKGAPDYTMAAQAGTPNLTPPSDTISVKDILSPTAAGPSFNLSATSSASSGPGSGEQGAVDPATAVVASPAGDANGSNNDPIGIVNAPTTSSTPADSTAPNTSNDPVGVVDAPTTSATPASSDATTAPQSGSNAPTTQSNPPAAAPPVGTNESSSSSKKKTGLGKLNPF
jgi:outer membrane protein assembly factor BamD